MGRQRRWRSVPVESIGTDAGVVVAGSVAGDESTGSDAVGVGAGVVVAGSVAGERIDGGQAVRVVAIGDDHQRPDQCRHRDPADNARLECLLASLAGGDDAHTVFGGRAPQRRPGPTSKLVEHRIVVTVQFRLPGSPGISVLMVGSSAPR